MKIGATGPARPTRTSLTTQPPQLSLRVLRSYGEKYYHNGYLHISCSFYLPPDGTVTIVPRYSGSFPNWTFDFRQWIATVVVESFCTGEIKYHSTTQLGGAIELNGLETPGKYQVRFDDGTLRPIIAAVFDLEPEKS